MSAPLSPRQLLERRITGVRSQLTQLIQQADNKYLRESLPRWEQMLDDLLRQATEEPEVTVSLVGGTGAGKTTLLNALLGTRLLPTKEGMPCTAAVCEIAHSSDGRYHCEVSFLSRDEWDAEVQRLKATLEAALPKPDESEDDRSVSSALAKAALQKLRGVYRADEGCDADWFVRERLEEPEAVKHALALGSESFSNDADQADAFTAGVKQFLSADDPFWPIVRAVRIRGPFPALAGGIKLVDLPGVNDPNEAREQVTRRYLKECKFVWLVFGIVRGLGKDLVQLMESDELFRQLIMDGRTDRLAFIGTRADNINYEEACSQYQLSPDAELPAILAARKENLRESVSQVFTELAERLADRAGEDRAKARGLIERLQNFALFSVSARDYLIFVRKKGGRDKPHLDNPEQTELPAVLRHLSGISEAHGYESHAQFIRQKLAALLGEVEREIQAQRVRTEQRGQMTVQQRKEVQEAAATALTFLDRKLKEYRERYEQDLKASRGLLTERFKRGTDLGRQKIENTLAAWSNIHAGTLGATCRNNGSFTTITKKKLNLPEDLTRPILDSIAFTWDEFFGERLGQTMKEWYDKLLGLAHQHSREFLDTVYRHLKSDSKLRPDLEKLQAATEKVLSEQFALSQSQMRERIEATRSTLYQRVPDNVRSFLRPAFEAAGKLSGSGVRRRMIEDHLRPAAHSVARDVFRDAEQEIDTELRALQDTLTRGYGEMAHTVRRHAKNNAENFWQDAHELSLDAIEQEKKKLKAAAATLTALSAA